MARGKKGTAKSHKASGRKPIEQYEHTDKTRKNNPQVGLVTPETDREAGRKTYTYDPHLDPQLLWAGKAEHTSFEVPTVSLHVHERIDPRTIVEAVRRRNGNGCPEQMPLFESPVENPPLRDAIDFYKHEHGWSNRLIAGDSLLVMNSLLEKEGLAGQVQMIYIDPPYGIKYGSNFQPFVNKRDVKDGKDEDLTQEPEMIRAFRDTWELGIHSYLTYLRDRLLLARELLHESGSCFVQIGDENLHHVRKIMDEVFGTVNFVSIISVRKTTSQGTATLLGATTDFIVWYTRDRVRTKYRQLYVPRSDVAEEKYDQALLSDGSVIAASKLSNSHSHNRARLFRIDNLTSSRPAGEGDVLEFEYKGKRYTPGKGTFKTNRDGLQRLVNADRLHVTASGGLNYRRFQDDFPLAAIGNLWHDISGAVQSRSDPKVYVVQSSTEIVARCLLMTTDPGDLVFDPTCGSGTTAYVAEQWGRRWITCDTSRVATTLAKQRLMTALFDYYELAHPEEGVGSGFRYKTVPHITLKSIANNPEIREGMSREEIDKAIAKYADQETLYDQPDVDKTRARVTGPFTVEAVPAPVVRPITEMDPSTSPSPLRGEGRDEGPADASVGRTGPTVRHAEWRDELLRCGIRGKSGQQILFSRVEPLAGTRWLHAEAETKPNDRGADSVREPKRPYGQAERVVISFGPEYAPLEQRQVELAWEEARHFSPKPTLLIFAAFQFDPEAAKDIDELTPEKMGMTFLKVQMNADLLTEDLKKKRASNESFWLIGQPEIEVRRAKESAIREVPLTAASPPRGRGRGEGASHSDLYEVEVHGFDYYNTKTGAIESGGTERIAMWMLDHDYDGRSLYPRQVFFPMAGENEGWAKLAKNLKAEIDEGLIEAYRGTVSLPFEPGNYRRVAVKIVDDRGIESLKIVEIKL